MTEREKLLEMALDRAETEEEKSTLRAFFKHLTEEQAAQLLTLDGFTEEYKLPIWDADLGGKPKDPNREHDTPPDGFIEGVSEPRRIAEDIATLVLGAGSFDEVLGRIETLPRLNLLNTQYWQRLGAILGKPRSSLPAVGGRRINKLDYPLDKVNASIWKLLEEDTNGQIRLAIKAEKAASKKEINIYYAVNFEELGVTTSKRLEAYDKRVYIAIAALYKAGNRIITCSQIHQAMGYTTRPAKTDIEKIRRSVLKMASTKVFLDNREEAQKGGYKYPSVVIDGPLLPIFHRHDCTVNGQTVPEAFAPICDPPIVDFARGRGQIISIDKKLLETPISKTDQNLQIEDYLLERVAHAQNKQQPTKILFATLYKAAQIASVKQQQRAASKIQAIMEHYKRNGFIAAYEMDKDGIRFSF